MKMRDFETEGDSSYQNKMSSVSSVIKSTTIRWFKEEKIFVVYYNLRDQESSVRRLYKNPRDILLPGGPITIRPDDAVTPNTNKWINNKENVTKNNLDVYRPKNQNEGFFSW